MSFGAGQLVRSNDMLDPLLQQYYVRSLREFRRGNMDAAAHLARQAGRYAVEHSIPSTVMASACDTAIEAVRDEFTDASAFVNIAIRCFAESAAALEEANRHLHAALQNLESIEEQLRNRNEELAAAQRNVELKGSRYQELFEFAPDAYVVTGMEGAIREANAAAAALLHTRRELLPGQALIEFVEPAGRCKFRDLLRELCLGVVERLDDWQVRIQPRSRPAFPAALTVIAERAAPSTAALRWLIRDVTERKRQERERARTLIGRAQAESARRFEFLANAGSLLVGSLDAESNLIGVARLAVQYLGGWCFVNVFDTDGSVRQIEVAHADPAETSLAAELRNHCLLRGKCHLVSPERPPQPWMSGPEFVERIDALFWERVSDGPEHAELLARINGGSAMVLPLRIRSRLLGAITLISGPGTRHRNTDRVLGEDLARSCALALENARLYRDVVAARDKAETASRAKDELVAVLAHELKNPLTPIMGWTQILRDHAINSKDAILQEAVRAMERNARTLTRLISDCLELAKNPEAKIRVEQRPVDLNEVILESVESVRYLAASRGLNLVVDPALRPITVLGDATRLAQVIVNLLINAAKYTPRNGVISVRTAVLGNQTEVAVQDTGIGIDREFLDRIFEPFRQGTSAWLTSESGLGLGLAIAKQIVKLHGGQIWAESDGLGQGSTFRIRLPLSLEHNRPLPPSRIHATNAAPASNGPNNENPLPHAPPPPAERDAACGLTILLVEDSTDILFLLKTELESFGYSVITAADGAAGTEMVRRHLPDLIISDVKMPILDGYELLRFVRRTPGLASIPAIALTGFGTESDRARAREAGFDECIVKPPDREHLLLAIQTLTHSRARIAALTETA